MPYSSNDPADYLAIGKQSARGTEATTFKFVKYLTGGVNIAQAAQTIFEGGDGQDPGLVYKSTVKPDGNFDAYGRVDTWNYLTAWAMGSGIAVASTAAVASHCYVPNSTVPLLTIEQAIGGGNQIDRVTDAIISGLTVDGQEGMPWKLSVPFIGGGTVYGRNGTASALSATLETGDPVMYAGGAYLIDGATNLDITQFSFGFTRSVDDNLFTVSPFRRAVVPLTRAYTLTFNVIYESPSLYQKILYGAAGGTISPFNLATGAFHAERILTASQMVSIDVPLLRYTDVQVNALEPNGQTMILSVTAQPLKGATSVVQLRTNTTAQATSYLL